MTPNMDEKMTNDSIIHLIVTMSIPAMIGIVSYHLYNIINTIYISRGVGIEAAGGLAVSLPLFVVLSAVSTTLGAGASSSLSRALGKKEMEKANVIAANTFLVFWTVAILITFIGLLFLKPMLHMMGVTEKIMPYAETYCRIILIGAISSTGFSSLMRAEGASKFAMYQWIIPVLTNILIDPIFIFWLKWDVAGAAIATVISQCVSVGMFAYFYFISKKSVLNIRWHHFCPDLRIIKEIILIGLPAFIQMIGFAITIVVINRVLSSYDNEINIGTYGITNKILAFLMIPLQGMVQGIQPIIGYNFGSQKIQRVQDILKQASRLAGGYGAIVTGAILLFSKQFMIPFTTDTQVILLGSQILVILGLGTGFSGIQMMQTTYFSSTGNVKVSIGVSLLNYTICFIPLLMLFTKVYGVTGVWISFPVSNILTLMISWGMVKSESRKYREQVASQC